MKEDKVKRKPGEAKDGVEEVCSFKWHGQGFEPTLKEVKE